MNWDFLANESFVLADFVVDEFGDIAFAGFDFLFNFLFEVGLLLLVALVDLLFEPFDFFDGGSFPMHSVEEGSLLGEVVVLDGAICSC